MTPPNDHTSKQFDADLEEIRSRVLQMGGVVESQIITATGAFSTGDTDAIAQVIETERRVNQLEKEIDDAVVHLVARRQPAASDLRLVMGITKIVTDLERIGDEAEKIARMARSIHSRGALAIPRFAEVRNVGNMAVAMLRGVLDSLARMEPKEASKLIAEDKLIDTEFRATMRQMITYMMEDPRTITTALDIVWIAKSIERVGDHAKNIAEQVIYIVEGVDVRHAGKDKDKDQGNSEAIA